MFRLYIFVLVSSQMKFVASYLLSFYASFPPVPDPIVQNCGYVSAKRVASRATLSGEC